MNYANRYAPRQMVGYGPQIVGYGPQIVGADPGAGQAALRANARGAGLQIPLGTPHAVAQQNDSFRQFPMGFNQAAVAASTQANVTSKPQVMFRGSRLVVLATVGANFKLTAVSVGNRSQFVSADSLPAGIFAENSVGVALILDTATPGIDITLSVLNTDTMAAHDFSGALIGDVLQ